MAEPLTIDESHRLISSDRVDGTVVYNRADEKLGTIRNFMVDKQSGQAEYAVLQFGGLFGIGSDHYPIPWSMLTYHPDKGGYVVDLSKEQVEGAPHYAEDRPDYDRAYGENVYGHYGVPYPII